MGTLNQTLFYLTNRRVFDTHALSAPALTPVKDSEGLARLATHLRLDDTTTDWFVVVYLRLLGAMPELGLGGGETTYKGLHLLDQGPVITQGVELRYPDSPVQPLPLRWPVNLDWLLSRVDDSRTRVHNVYEETAKVITSRVIPEDSGETVVVEASEFFPYNLKLHITLGNPWSSGDLNHIDLYFEPATFPYKEVLDTIPDQSFVNTILREHGLFDDYNHAMSAHERLALLLKAVVKSREVRHAG